MKRLSRLVLLLALAIGVTVLVRKLAAERAPTHGLNGSGHAPGSLDTWPPVPRKPAGAARN
jgi:hypothetical protein